MFAATLPGRNGLGIEPVPPHREEWFLVAVGTTVAAVTKSFMSSSAGALAGERT